MQQLSGMDSLFLDIETNSCPTHIGGLMILDVSGTGREFEFKDVLELLRSRLDVAPQFRRRLIETPLGLDHPYWLEDPEFELENHVHHRALPRPGNHLQLEELVCDIISRRLDRSRPLWEYYYIEGLEGGKVAIVSKIHHAYIDGVSGAQLMVSMLDLSPEPRKLKPPREPWRPDPFPSDFDLYVKTLKGMVRRPRIGFRAARGSLRAAFQAGRQKLAREKIASSGVGNAPRTRFNTTINARRSYAWRSLSLDDVKFIKNTFETTVNDVVMTVCGEALRRYLLEKGELPEKSLVAGIPMSVRKAGEKGGNQVTLVRASLRSDQEDMVARLKTISNSMNRVKRKRGGIGASVLMDWTRFSSPALLGSAARLYEHFSIQDYHHPSHNVEISNVPGSPQPLYFAGARIQSSYPINIPYHGLALVITLMSYMNQLDFSLTAHRDSVPDIWHLMDLVEEALAELRQHATEESTRVA